MFYISTSNGFGQKLWTVWIKLGWLDFTDKIFLIIHQITLRVLNDMF